MFRLSLAINDYIDRHKLLRSNEIRPLDLTQKAERVLQYVTKADESKNADLRGFRNNILTKTSPTSLQSLNGFIHNKFQIPTADALRAGWDCSIPIFIAAFGEA